MEITEEKIREFLRNEERIIRSEWQDEYCALIQRFLKWQEKHSANTPVSVELPNDFTVNSMVSFLKDQAGDKVSADYVDGYRTGLMKMKSMMLDIIEKMK